MRLFQLKKPAGRSSRQYRPNWREYQQRLKQKSKRDLHLKRGLWLMGGLLVFILIIAAVIKAISGNPRRSLELESPPLPVNIPEKSLIDKKSVQILLDGQLSGTIIADAFQIEVGGQPLQVTTTLDTELQKSIIDNFDRKNSRYIGVVTLSPDDGRVLSLAGFDKEHSEENPCINNQFPAASIFKIVTAAAAVEKLDFNADSIIKFNGYKHTLYKKQLKEQDNRYTNKIRFGDSFAQSVNPVFGKLGILYLKKPILEEFSSVFGFNKRVDFEIAMPPSRLTINDEPYHWAEIASGFNRQTTLTPVHGAMMAAAVINGGKMAQPTIVDRITDPEGKVIYRTTPQIFGTPMADHTAQILRQLMEKTIKSGTAKKAFRGYQRNKTLSKLNIGGKTGSIFNNAHDLRFDWFVGFAVEKGGSEKIAVSVVVAHEEYIGRRATDYAKLAFLHHFKHYFAGGKKSNKTDGKES